jgi:hypothetical protein
MKKLHWLWLFLLIGGSVRALPAPVPVLDINPTSFVFDVPVNGPNPTPGQLTISNIGTGGGKMDWKAEEETPVGWLSLSAGTGPGLNPHASVQIAVQIDVTGLAGGITYTNRIKVSSTAAASTLYADVTLHVNSDPRIGVTPGKLVFAAPEGGPNPGSQPLTIQNTGGGPLDWTATLTPSSSWLKVNKTSGNLAPAASEQMNVSIDVIGTGLTADPLPYKGSILFAASDPLVPTKTVDIELTVSQNPSISVTPTTVTFDTPVGSNPANKTFTVKNVGGGTLKWLATVDIASTWLTLSPNPAKGNLNGGQSATVTMIVDTSSLPLVEASYVATITVKDEFDAAIAEKKVDVTLNVNATPKIGLNPTTLDFTVPEDSGGSSPQAVSVTNTGQGVLNWKLVGGAAWLKSSKTGGALNPLQSEPVQISVNPKGLTANVYTTTVEIQDGAASNSPVVLAIQMTVKTSSLPTSAPAGQCGMLGLEALAALLLLRTLTSRGGPRCF